MKKSYTAKKLKRTACVLAAGMMIFSSGAVFTGCGKKSDTPAGMTAEQQVQAVKSMAYKVEDVSLKETFYDRIVTKNDLLYTTVSSYEERDDGYFTSTFVICFDKAGTIKSKLPVYVQTDLNEYCNIQGGLSIDDNGNITFILNKGSWDPVTYESKSSQQLITIDGEGNQIKCVDINNIVSDEEMNNGMYFAGCVVDGKGFIYCNLQKCVRVLDDSGNVLFTTPELGENGWINDIIYTNKGIPAIGYYEYNENESVYKLVEINSETKGFGQEYKLVNMGQLYSGSGEYLCYFSGDTGINGVKEDLSTVSVLNLLNLGIDNSNISGFTICEDGSFITTGNNYSGENTGTTVSFITPVDPSEVKEKKIISLGCYYLDWNIRSKLAEFNKTNEEYVINVISYSDSNDTTDYTAALTKFNNEMLAGNIPDILVLNNNMPYDSYVAKGLFTDMYQLIENDPDLTKESFLPNVLRAVERNGKLYAMPLTFNIQSYAAKKSLVGDVNSITMDKANEILATMEEGATLTNSLMARNDFIYNAVYSSDFIDYENASCSFDTPEFKAILEAAKDYPKEIDWDSLYNDNPDYWTEQEKAVLDNRALLYSAYLYNFESYNQIKYAYIGEDMSMVGFPGTSTNEKGGSMLSFSSQLAISDKSKNKEGAWSFIKELLMSTVYLQDNNNYDMYKDAVSEGESLAADADSASAETSETARWECDNGFPVVVELFDKIADQATKPRKWKDENGEIHEEENSWWIGDREVKIPTMTQADVEEFRTFVYSVERVTNYDTSVQDIINDDIEGFFSGSKSADDTAASIQSRVSLYLSEQYS